MSFCHRHSDARTRFPLYWPFVRGSHRWPECSLDKGLLIQKSTWHRYIPRTNGEQCGVLIRLLMATLNNCWTNTRVTSYLRHFYAYVTSSPPPPPPPPPLLGFCEGNPPVTCVLPSQKASNVEIHQSLTHWLVPTMKGQQCWVFIHILLLPWRTV